MSWKERYMEIKIGDLVKLNGLAFKETTYFDYTEHKRQIGEIKYINGVGDFNIEWKDGNISCAPRKYLEKIK